MRKWNAVLSAAILVLFAIHGIAGAFQMTGIIPGGQAVLSALAWLLIALLVLHILIGIKLTADTLRAQKKAGVSYFRENKLFWARRISGFAVFLLMFFHLVLFVSGGEGAMRLKLFDGSALALSLLLVAAVAVHILSNIRPMLIALGIRSFKEFAADILIIISVILLFCGIAFFIYYLRWAAI